MSLEAVNVHPLSGYSFIERESQPEEDNSVTARLKRLEDQYAESGIRRSVEAIMLVNVHDFPHVLVLQVANAFYKLPGGYLDPVESDSSGLINRLNEQLGVPFTPSLIHAGGDWKVGDLLGTWWRPNYDTFYYPYIPAHISQPKECKKLYLVELPPNKTFAVPVNMKLHAIPVYEFYDNAARYGPQFAGIPYILSKYGIYHQLPAETEAHGGKR
ncbi:cleavage and polyadenylation specificity factor subunit 5 [Kwoniella mangroviensis CBS 8886]|nr:cleavage and polyadenylation specificity factor subunit 5 [Kwoniella mangroviensis CBS 8507]OCF70017.1 cleavage and polyadenylation specificity factor subunit 5 [Kwoniella mangroviensis CBS 8507]OCF75795.1 cleavage and polyadenylation specificity factor subunit 5 [Kwoniella mangroviensis CBS 8886]